MGIGKGVYTALVLFALILLPLSLAASLNNKPSGEGSVYYVIGRNHQATHDSSPESAYWMVSEKAWRFVEAGIPASGVGKNEIRVKKGAAVTLKITSYDSMHGFTLPGYGINERIYPGKLTVVNFKADRAGEYPFFCSIICGMPGHPWMKGKLIVE